jgi:hypothetical protein
MPIKVGPNETEEEFISRCMSVEKDSIPEENQRLAVCYSYWENKGMSFQKIVCDKCGWSWELEDGGDDPYLCHKCGNRMTKPVSEEAQQGGVVGQAMSRTKFEYKPNSKEKMPDFMSRCMSDPMVREKKQNRVNRANFCYRNYQDFYVMSIGRRWR